MMVQPQEVLKSSTQISGDRGRERGHFGSRLGNQNQQQENHSYRGVVTLEVGATKENAVHGKGTSK